MARRFKWPKIYIFGDSLTQFAYSKDGGWASIIADEFQRKADIIARGFSGYNTRQCKVLLPYLESDLRDVSIAGVFLGANDANDPDFNPQQSVPIDEYKENLNTIVSFMKKSDPSPSIFLVTPPALDEEKWRKFCQSEGKICGNRSHLVVQYASACVETAKGIGVHCIDIHTAMLQQNDWKEFLNDGLHFSAKGSEFIASQMLPTLKTLMAEGNLGGGEDGIMPLYSDVSNVDPDSSFRNWLGSQK